MPQPRCFSKVDAVLAEAGAAQRRLPDPSQSPGAAHMQAICAHDPDGTLTGAAAPSRSGPFGIGLSTWPDTSAGIADGE